MDSLRSKKNNEVDFTDSSKTENTRVSYPIFHIQNIAKPSVGTIPKNIFFLTADAFGVLPPISKLTNNQAMYHFISGYTSKIAGTEEGIIEPQATFSACFAAPFMPLHPIIYTNMLGNKIKEGDVNVWLINTGWSGGEYGRGNRIRLKYTRAMITAAMNNKLDNIDYQKHEIFQLNMPKTCPGVPEEILNPSNTWQNKLKYLKKTKVLSNLFHQNFKRIKKSIEAHSNMKKNTLKNILLGGPIKIKGKN